MLGKYDFEPKHLQAVLKYFNITTAYAVAWLGLSDEFFTINNLNFTKFGQLKHNLATIKYLDEFQEVRDEFYFAYEDAVFFLLKLENEGVEIDFDDIRTKLFTVKESFLFTDNLVRFCYDWVAKFQQVPDFSTISEQIIKKLSLYLKQLLALNKETNHFFDPETYQIFEEQLNCTKIKLWNDFITKQSDDFENKFSNQQEMVLNINDINVNYWKIMGLFVQMKALCELAILLNPVIT